MLNIGHFCAFFPFRALIFNAETPPAPRRRKGLREGKFPLRFQRALDRERWFRFRGQLGEVSMQNTVCKLQVRQAKPSGRVRGTPLLLFCGEIELRFLGEERSSRSPEIL